MNTNEGYVYFAFSGENFDPDELTTFLGIQATQAWKKSTRDLERGLPKRGIWNFSSEKVVNELIDVYELSSRLVEQLKPKTQRIIEAKSRFNVEPYLQVVLWISMHEEHSTPAIGFEVDVIEFLAQVGASIDIDTYRNWD